MGWLRSPAALVLLPLGITVSLTLSAFWIIHRFTLEGRLQDRFGSIVKRAPMKSGLRQPPVDLSSSVCPHIDNVLRAEISPRTEVRVGWGFGERLLIIEVGPLDQCSASVSPGVAF